MKEIRESGENYLEVIGDIEKEFGIVKSVEIARRVGVSRASVSKALGVLRNLGLVEPSYYGNVRLTAAGQKRAAEVRRRHNTIFIYLTDVLGMSQENADLDACRMEHIVSEELIDKVEQKLRNRNDTIDCG